jgi:hypothetical protein
MVPSKVRDVDIDGMELLGQQRHVDNTCALTAEWCWNQAAQEARCDGLFVERSGGGEAGERRRQVFRGRHHLRQHVAGEGACVRAQALLFGRQREIDGHGRFGICSAAEPRRSTTKTGARHGRAIVYRASEWSVRFDRTLALSPVRPRRLRHFNADVLVFLTYIAV